MCGIAGIVDPRGGAEGGEAALEAMLRALRHRGPDGEGRWAGPGCRLAHARLAVSSPAHNPQPRESPDGRYVLVYNGELYNAEELHHALAREYPFDGETDTEAVLAALVLEGPRALRKLDGMFALCLWDRQTRTALLARDRLGVKPLVYERRGTALRFASEAKALLAAGATPSLHLPALAEWAAAPAFSGVEHSLFEGIEVLPPGHLLEVSERGVELRRWADFVPARRAKPEAVLLDEVQRTVYVGVSRAADAEVPVGVFLSGGFDSTLIAGVANFFAEELPAFSVRFEGQAGFDYARSQITLSDDTPFAELAAKELELEHHWVDVPRAELARDLEAISRIDDALPAWEQEVAQHHLARAAVQRVKVVLVGDAADETHYGYHFLLDPEASASPEALLARLGAPERVRLLHPALRAELDPLRTLPERYRALVAESGLHWGDRRESLRATTSLIVKRWLPRLLHNGDVHTMAFGLEARVPFAETGLVDMAEAVDPELALRGGADKWHLREAMGGELPDAIRWRRKSALPKDQGAEPVYRAEAARLLREADPVVARHLDLARVRELAGLPRPLTEGERASLFQAICFGHFCRHYGVR